MRKTGQRTDTDGALFIKTYSPHLIQTIDADQLRSRAPSLPYLNENVASACNDLSLRMLREQLYRMFYTFCLV